MTSLNRIVMLSSVFSVFLHLLLYLYKTHGYIRLFHLSFFSPKSKTVFSKNLMCEMKSYTDIEVTWTSPPLSPPGLPL